MPRRADEFVRSCQVKTRFRERVEDYHAPGNQFERFVFLLISRFEFDFRRCGIFFERFEFLVCSKFNHMQ